MKRSLYGLKQAGRIWNQNISEKLKRLGYQPSVTDPCLYIRNVDGVMSFILLYVDDMLVASSDNDEYERVYRYLSKHFKLMAQVDITWAFKWRG